MSQHELGLAATLLKNGEMKQIELDGQGVVVARVDGLYYAFSPKCTHYGGPLAKGVLRDHTVVCPWHHAYFDIRDGRRLEPPALADLPRFPVTIEDGKVFVTLPPIKPAFPEVETVDEKAGRFVIVGGGAAASAAALELRRAGFTGLIRIISADSNVPVDRPNLSKDYLDGHAKPEWVPLWGKGWYAKRGIDLSLETEVVSVDPQKHIVTLKDGSVIPYDKLLLATGGTPRMLTKVPGYDLKGIYTLRTLEDADRIIQAVGEGKNVAVIGASFIGLEGAASLAGGRKANVTVIGLEAVPFAPILGEEIGKMFQKEHEDNGVKFLLEDTVTRFVGEKGSVKQLELKSGKVLDVDAVVVGIGVVPATAFLQEAGLDMHEKDHSILVNSSLQTSQPDIYAAGDIARWHAAGTESTRIEHWRVAQQQGVVAARNMLGGNTLVTDHVPFFWTTQWGITLNYVGHAAQWDEIIYRGSPKEKKFIAFYLQKGELKAAAGCGHDAALAALEVILEHKLPLSKEQMKDEAFDLVQLAQHGHCKCHAQ